jgi:hypothetical protein
MTPSRPLGMALVCLAAVSLASAYSTLRLPATGTATLPTAAVVPAQQVQVAVDMLDAPNNSIYQTRLLYGASPNLEAGLGINTDLDGSTELTLGGKFQFGEKFLQMDWAAGLALAIEDDDDMQRAYLVGSRSVKDDLTVSLGLVAARTDIANVSNTDVRPFFSLEKGLGVGSSVLGEFIPKKDGEAESATALAFRHALTESTTVQIGWVSNGTGDSTLFLGASFNLDDL